jgi:selenocysteine lyase/cysteine desulfurase
MASSRPPLDPLVEATRFAVSGTFLNAAYTHPMSVASASAIKTYLDARMQNGAASGYSMVEDRNAALGLFARLVHCDPDELGWIPSTMAGENLVAAGLQLAEEGAHIVTDPAHFEGSLYLYRQLEARGANVTVLPLVDNGVTLDVLDAAIQPGTRLVVLSLVSALNGFTHDLRAVCELAHAKGAMVYADIIQAAGAIPVDLHASGVDFAACSTYKWLMGDFGAGFLYVRRDRLDRLRQVQFGYRQLAGFRTHHLPFDEPGPDMLSYELRDGTARVSEVGTLGNAGVAALRVSLDYLLHTGVDRIATHRRMLLDRLQDRLPAAGFVPLTRRDSTGPLVTFAVRDGEALRPRLEQAGINVQLYRHRIRISPSVYNTMDDIDRLVDVLAQP